MFALLFADPLELLLSTEDTEVLAASPPDSSMVPELREYQLLLALEEDRNSVKQSKQMELLSRKRAARMSIGALGRA